MWYNSYDTALTNWKNSCRLFYLEYILKRQYKVCNIVFFYPFFVAKFLASWHLVKAIKTTNMASANFTDTCVNKDTRI